MNITDLVMFVEALSASFYDVPKPSPWLSITERPTLHLQMCTKKVWSPVSATLSPILRRGSSSSISMPQPQRPVDPAPILAHEERRDRSSRCPSLTVLGRSSRSNLRATQEKQQEDVGLKFPLRSEFPRTKGLQLALQYETRELGIRQRTLCSRSHNQNTSDIVPPSTSSSRPTSPSYAHDLYRSISPATPTLRPLCWALPRIINMGVICQATPARMANHHTSQHPSSSSPLVNSSGMSNFRYSLATLGRQ
ncbi:hypothetical protein EV361DRAFT_980313 [Lentinula raphanica]|nr:hypothetical protein EV361DRAFT_980313 [Lentinula raphanica]